MKLKWAPPACARERPPTENSQSAETIVTNGQGVKCVAMPDLFRRGKVLPEGRTNEEEMKLLAASPMVSTIHGATDDGGQRWRNSFCSDYQELTQN